MASPAERGAEALGLFRLWLSIGLAGCAVLLYGCLMPNPPHGPDVADFDKIEHFSAFVVLGAWFAAVFMPRYLTVFCALSLFGGVIEILQWWTGYRDAQVSDWVADSLGAIVGLWLTRFGAMGWLRYIDSRVTKRRTRPG